MLLVDGKQAATRKDLGPLNYSLSESHGQQGEKK
jgi:hypothetical protein